MKSDAPEIIYVCDNVFPSHVDWDGSPINTKRIDDHDIEYVRKNAFIEKACEYWYQYNRNIVKKHGAKAVLGCSEFTVNVEDFKKYMEE